MTNKTASMKHTDKLKIGLYCNELTEKQATSLLKRLGTGALNLGKGIGQGAMTAGKEMAALPMKGLNNFGNKGLEGLLNNAKGLKPGNRAMATGKALGAGGAIGGAAALPVMGAGSLLDRSKNKGLEQGKQEGMSAALAGVQKSKQDRGYIGTLLDALMNRQ